MKHIYITFFCLSVLLLSCDQDDPNVKHTNTEALAGEWFVTYTLDGADEGGGYSTIITSNTAANTASEILVTDYVDPNDTEGHFWSYKVKANADVNAKTFSASNAVSSAIVDDEPYPIKINITNGKVIRNGGFSKTGVVVDSIYFEIEFEDDPGNTYIASGHKRTGFTEDEFH